MSSENNEDTSTGGGIRSHVDLEVGYLAMVGVEVESDINFGVSVSDNATFFTTRLISI